MSLNHTSLHSLILSSTLPTIALLKSIQSLSLLSLEEQGVSKLEYFSNSEEILKIKTFSVDYAIEKA